MEWWQSLILGLVEGLTEYLPVSSTGHLILAQRLMGIDKSDANDAFAICIQAGAILAVLGLYWRRVLQMFQGLLGKDEEGLRLVGCLIAGFLPAAVAGLTFGKHIKHYLFGLGPIVVAWIVGGIAILAVAAYAKKQKSEVKSSLGALTWKAALIIGIIQCVAMWPGTSRSLVTIAGGVLVGLSLPAAVEFSFLLGVLTLSAATAKDGLEYGKEMLELFGPTSILIGLFSAWISAVLAVKWMVAYLNKHGLSVFGYYRIVLGLVVAGLIAAGYLTA